jgi:hypothetical protein
VWRGDEIFLTQFRNSFPPGIEPGIREVLLRSFTITTMTLSQN